MLVLKTFLTYFYTMYSYKHCSTPWFTTNKKLENAHKINIKKLALGCITGNFLRNFLQCVRKKTNTEMSSSPIGRKLCLKKEKHRQMIRPAFF